MAGKQRIDGARAFVLHSRPFRETSLLVEAFAREHGRVALVARGARRPRSSLRGALLEFQPVELSWFGAAEVKTLVRAEWLGGQRLLQGAQLLSGYYLNELLLRLLAREDAHPQLFDRYAEATRALALAQAPAPALRRFELALLRELGYALLLEHEADSAVPVQPARRYAYHVERGPVPAEADEASLSVSGATLLAMRDDDFSAAATLQESRALMRRVLQHYLGHPPLRSRQVFMELQEL